MTVYYLISHSDDPYYNISLEDYLYTQRRDLESIYFLWINRPSVFMGRYQHAPAETDIAYLEAKGIPVLRRSSGGGTVYHDHGNLCFTSIQTAQEGKIFDLKTFPQPIISALARVGVEVTCPPRGDLRHKDLKVAGAAEATRQGRMLYHLCILHSTDLTELERVLAVPAQERSLSRVASVRSSVMNLREVLPPELSTIEAWQDHIIDELKRIHGDKLQALTLPPDAEDYIQRIRQEKYEHPSWIHSPIGLARH